MRIALVLTALAFIFANEALAEKTPLHPAVLSGAATVSAESLAPVTPEDLSVAPKIVNGLVTSGFPSVGFLVGSSLCTGTLIGCQTFLTAAHCVEDDLNPSNYFVFFQHNGSYSVSSVSIAPGYLEGVPGSPHDLAVLRLAAPVNGIAPSQINTLARPGFGTSAVVVGFGKTSGESSQPTGVKRVGLITTASCSPPSRNSTHICWDFLAPVGPAGVDSSICQGDSGGPLFAGNVVAAVSSAVNPGCLPPNHPIDSDVFVDRTWIQTVGGADLNNATCGSLPPAGSAGSPILAATGILNGGNTSDDFNFQVPAGTDFLLVTLNGEDGGPDFDLYVKNGSPASPASFDCKSDSLGVLEGCGFNAPAPGTWFLQALRFSGNGLYQVTVTLFGAGSASAGPCVPSASTLCINDQPGDRRFSAEVSWNRPGALGTAGAIALDSLGVTRGGLFWIGNPANPEILLKVLNGCAVNGHYWVFYSAGTNQGLDLTVRDTLTGRVWTDSNPNGTLAPPVADTQAFPCN